jgi:alpha/beta superfamily hydrolase
MNSHTVRESLAGPAGAIECAIDSPPGQAQGIAVICHPHPVHGGTLDNKVVITLVRAFLAIGYRTVRFNFRGVGASHGSWDEGRGEVDDALAVIAHYRDAAQPFMLAGFSFGAYVASQAASRLADDAKPLRMVLVGPSTQKQQMATVPADTIVVHGEADDVVPLQATLDWARPQSLPVIVLPGVGHFFHGQLTLLKNVLVQQLQRPRI